MTSRYSKKSLYFVERSSPDDCPSFEIGTWSGPDAWEWNVWQYPATTEQQCLGEGHGRDGCLRKTNEGYRNFWYDVENCKYFGGTPQKVFRCE